MKAITIHQPWATLIALGEKKFETRGWKTNYRGPIAIHASKQLLYDHRLPKLSSTLWEHGFRKEDDFPLGCVLAIAELVDCRKVSDWLTNKGMPVLHGAEDDYYLDDKEYAFGDYTPGRYAWELINIKRIEPVPVKGKQGLWNWNYGTCINCKEDKELLLLEDQQGICEDCAQVMSDLAP
jgi:hypothetical protein